MQLYSFATNRLAWVSVLAVLFVGGIRAEEPKTVEDPPAIAQAKCFMERFIELGREWDPKVADLYSDKAVVSITRKYPDGSERSINLTGKQVKKLTKATMPLAKMRGDRDRYSELEYEIEEAGVRVTAKRYNELKKTETPINWLLTHNDEDGWQILEENAESQVLPQQSPARSE